MLKRTTQVLFLTFILSIILAIPIARAYPYEDTFKKDLLGIVNSVPQVESINIYNWEDTRPSGHLWAYIRINYTTGVSDSEKVSIQNNVQYQLESKSYIDIVQPNYISTIPEVPPPRLGFEVGVLLVAFKSQISTVGGWSFSVAKAASSAPYIGLASIAIVAVFAIITTTIYSKGIKRRKEKQ